MSGGGSPVELLDSSPPLLLLLLLLDVSPCSVELLVLSVAVSPVLGPPVLVLGAAVLSAVEVTSELLPVGSLDVEVSGDEVLGPDVLLEPSVCVLEASSAQPLSASRAVPMYAVVEDFDAWRMTSVLRALAPGFKP